MRRPRRTFVGDHINWIWQDLLMTLVEQGQPVSPRGLPVKEIIGVHARLEDPLGNILHHTGRNVSYKFMVAEWLWMWFGRDDVATIARYNPQIAKFSDNSVDFNGAYGVPLARQWAKVRDTLRKDPDTRQAVIQIYTPPTRPTKDVPCTINLQFLLRDGKLETIANMRSSDVWLGLPYDVFNFTMLGQCMAVDVDAAPGPLTMHLGSSHLYASNFDAAEGCIRNAAAIHTVKSPVLPSLPPVLLEDILVDPDGTNWPTLARPWWEYANVLGGRKHTALGNLMSAGGL